MNEIRWFESQPGQKMLTSLRKYDHHQIKIDGEAAVLMTHVNLDSLERGLLAVIHSAADRHPEVPQRVKDAMARLVWEPTLPPRR